VCPSSPLSATTCVCTQIMQRRNVNSLMENKTMDKQTINAVRSRARVAIHTTGGRVTGQHHRLPVVYACPPVGGPVWPVTEIIQTFSGLRRVVKTSCIDGCTVVWQ
ncbi:hypothetical protein, partial [Escherichia coli]